MADMQEELDSARSVNSDSDPSDELVVTYSDLQDQVELMRQEIERLRTERSASTSWSEAPPSYESD